MPLSCDIPLHLVDEPRTSSQYEFGLSLPGFCSRGFTDIPAELLAELCRENVVEGKPEELNLVLNVSNV